MNFEKRYLQFNELVFDGFDMISEYDEPLQFKGSSTPYSYGHGSYMPNKDDYLYVSERTVNATISLKLKKLPCNDRIDYVRFAEQELGKPGRLWAIKNNEIIWSLARVNNLRPVNSGRQNVVEYDVEFIVPGGVWHKADKQRTFLLPYDICSFMACKGFGNINPIASSKGMIDGVCVSCKIGEDNKVERAWLESCGCCCSDEVSEDMALGLHLDELQKFYGCDTPYQIKYDCEAAENFNNNPAFGQKLTVEDICSDSIIAGQIYSDTDIPTDEMVLTLFGDMKDPAITINGNTNIIKGEYHGKLTVEPSGDVYYLENADCAEAEQLDPSVWSIPENMDYGWMIHPRLNGVVVNMNLCCGSGGLNSIYIDHSPLTT